jgi:DNA-directed RNA polymerase
MGPMVDALDLSRQAAWEVAATERAVKRYREAVAERDPAELPPGRRVLAETVGPVAAVLERRLDEVVQGSKGAPPGWHQALLLFEPDVIAFIAVATALRSAPMAQSRVGQTLVQFAKRVCSTLRDQADHDRWMRETRKAAEDDPQARALLGRWKRLHPQADRRAWTRFAGRLEGARSARWSEAIRVEVGAMLAQALAEGAPRWFEVARVGEDPREEWRPVCIALTDHAVERMADVETRAEVARPLMLPMIIPPNPWRYVERPNQETTR